jgi:hypothetical protein
MFAGGSSPRQMTGAGGAGAVAAQEGAHHSVDHPQQLSNMAAGRVTLEMARPEASCALLPGRLSGITERAYACATFIPVRHWASGGVADAQRSSAQLAACTLWVPTATQPDQ